MTILVKQNVYKYCKNTKQIPAFAAQYFTMFIKSYRKMREIYLTDYAIYIVSRHKLKTRVALDQIQKVYIALLSGQIFIVSSKTSFIIDSTESKYQIIQYIKKQSPLSTFEYINFTTLDFLFEKHKKIDPNVKMTDYDSNQKKVQVFNIVGEKMNLRKLRAQWEVRADNVNLKNKEQQKNYEIVDQILQNTYWNIYKVKNLNNQRLYTLKVYPKKFIGMQEDLLTYIWNQRRNLQYLTTPFTPSLVKSFYSNSSIYIVCQYYNGFLLQAYKSIKKHKLVNILAQLVVAIGQLHQAGLVYANINKNGIMIDKKGYMFLFNIGMSVNKDVICQTEIHSKTPQAIQNDNIKADYGWDWWNLGQLIYQMIEETPFYPSSMQVNSITQYLKSVQNKTFPSEIRPLKWQKQDKLLDLFYQLINKNSAQRIGNQNDYHQVLHHTYFHNFLEQHPKTEIMKKLCPPVIKKIIQDKDKTNKTVIKSKHYENEDDWSQLDSYLKGYQFSRQVQ